MINHLFWVTFMIFEEVIFDKVSDFHLEYNCSNRNCYKKMGTTLKCSQSWATKKLYQQVFETHSWNSSSLITFHKEKRKKTFPCPPLCVFYFSIVSSKILIKYA